MTFWILCFLKFSTYHRQCFIFIPFIKNIVNYIIEYPLIYLIEYIATIKQYCLNKELIDLRLTMCGSNEFKCRERQRQ